MSIALVIVIVVGVVAGALAGLFGVGGGIVFVPALVFVLGLTQLHAEATSLLAILPTAAVGSWRQLRYGNVRIGPALLVGLGTIAGVQGGVLVAEALPESALRRLFGVFLVLVAAHLVWRTRRA